MIDEPCHKCEGEKNVWIDNGYSNDTSFVTCPRCKGIGVEKDGWKKPSEKPENEEYIMAVWHNAGGENEIIVAFYSMVEKSWVDMYFEECITIYAWRELPPLPPWIGDKT